MFILSFSIYFLYPLCVIPYRFGFFPHLVCWIIRFLYSLSTRSRNSKCWRHSCQSMLFNKSVCTCPRRLLVEHELYRFARRERYSRVQVQLQTRVQRQWDSVHWWVIYDWAIGLFDIKTHKNISAFCCLSEPLFMHFRYKWEKSIGTGLEIIDVVFRRYVWDIKRLLWKHIKSFFALQIPQNVLSSDACVNYCLNDGICRKDTQGNEECQCKENFSGVRCEIRFQPRSQALIYILVSVVAIALIFIAIVVVNI